MKSSKDILREFVESVRGKDCSEVIILADREATRAYRNSLCSCSQFHHASGDWCQYCDNLTQMIYFLRHEVKLKKPGGHSHLFQSLQKGIDQRNLKFIRHYKVKHENI